MATVHLSNVPDELYNRLLALAQAEQRSLDEQIIFMLEQRLPAKDVLPTQAQLLAEIRRTRFTPPQTAPDSVEMLREDRRR